MLARPRAAGAHGLIRTLYLRSYDRYDERLAYALPEGTWRIVAPDAGVTETFGLTRAGDRVAGVYASPDGPTFFVDGRRVVGRFGATVASVDRVASRRMRFVLHDGGRPMFAVDYDERHGIGTNPNDREPADVDLFALMAAGTRGEQFFIGYTRDWVA